MSRDKMDYKQYTELYNQRFHSDIFFACQFLELRGMRFLIDYGWEDAVDKASRLMVKELYHGD
jgi:hypothetical protein